MQTAKKIRESLWRVGIGFLADNSGRAVTAVFFQAKIYLYIYARRSVSLIQQFINFLKAKWFIIFRYF